VGNRQRRSRRKRACRQVGDGRPRNPGVGTDPNPASSTRARTMRAGLTDETARLARDAVRPEPGTARQRNGFGLTTFRGTRWGRLCEWPKVIHARDRRDGSPSKIEDQWCRSRPCGQLAGLLPSLLALPPTRRCSFGRDHLTMEPYCCSKSPKSAVWLHSASRSPFPPSSVL